MTIKVELEALMKEDTTTVHQIEDWAKRHPRSSLYKELKYDDTAGAAHLWRLGHIRQLVAIYMVDSEYRRETISLTIDRSDGGYRQMTSVLDTPNLRDVAVHDVLTELLRFKLKNEALGFDEFDPVWRAIESVKDDLQPPPSRPSSVQQSVVEQSVAQQV